MIGAVFIAANTFGALGFASRKVASGYTNTFGYDTAGNFTTLRSASIAAANSDNQLTGTGYAYDGNGNPTSYNGNSLTFDPENRLNKDANGASSLMQAGYGADGLRAWRIDASGQTTSDPVSHSEAIALRSRLGRPGLLPGINCTDHASGVKG